MQRSQPKPAAKFEPRFITIAQELLAAGVPLPVPLERAINGDSVPLALSTRADLPAWAELHGYDPAQTARLSQAFGELVRTPKYLEALATDLAERVDVDGNVVERVTHEHALVAALMLNSRELRKAAREARA